MKLMAGCYKKDNLQIYIGPVAWFVAMVVDATMNSIANLTQNVSFRIENINRASCRKYALYL